MIIHGEVDRTPPKLKQQLPWIAVAHVLLLGVGNGLLGQVVLQLERGRGQAIDENAEVERKLRFIFAIPKLTGHAEDVGAVLLLRLRIAGRGSSIKDLDGRRAVVDSLAKNIHHAALGDFTLKAGEKLLALRAFFFEA